ncbi:MAG: DEAD/DEAH box helicase [Caulobacteraceae bacterium]
METLKFTELNLSKEIQKAIEDKGFEEATPIQSQAIPFVLEGIDIIGQAQTGTGKTAAFGIPILEMIRPEDKAVQALILCPTRELAIQVAEEIRELGKYKRGIEVLPVYGGQPIDRQIKALKKRPQVIVGTPGRVMDHMNRGTLKLNTVKMAVLDEADEMLDMGFIDDIITILKAVPEERQTLLFSATMPQAILELTKKFQRKPKHVKVVHKELTAPKIEQVYFEVKEKTKPEVLSRLLDMYNPKLSLVFCNTKKKVDELVEELQGRGYFADGLHGDLKQVQRDRVMAKFRSGNVDILVATDVAARGIDVDDIEAVFNYDLPQDEEYYVHRIGRTARAGRAGKAFTFIVGREIYKLKDIQRYSKAKMKLQQVPSSEDVEEVRTNKFLDKIKETIEEGRLSEYVAAVERLVGDEYTSLDIAAALLKMTIGEKTKTDQEDSFNFDNTGADPGMVRLFINIGRNQNIRPGDVVGGIAGETGLPGKLIGSIDIYDKYTFVEIPREYAQDVIRIMKDNQIKGKRINIEPANARH